MPARPPMACPSCGKLYTARRCPCRTAWAGSAWHDPKLRSGTVRRQWQAMRDAKLDAQPRCEYPGCDRPAVVVDHKVPLKVDPKGLLDWNNLASLCDPHHQEKTKRDALIGRGLPTDEDEWAWLA